MDQTVYGEQLGTAVLSISESVPAGSFQEFTLTYTAGFYGIDDSGSIKICFRFATDMTAPQFDDPAAAGFVSAVCSNGATLLPRWDVKDNVRPWGKTLYLKVTNGFLTVGDTITVRFGDRSRGGPGMRIQTFCEDTWELKVLVDAFATYRYVELPESPTVRVAPGPAERWKAIVPTTAARGETFSLHLVAEDVWGNATREGPRKLSLSAGRAVVGLPREVSAPEAGRSAVSVGGLSCDQEGVVRITLRDGDRILACSNPLVVRSSAAERRYWGDMHGQTEETIGTNTVDDYFAYARDVSRLDFASHQGNDFQITREFWRKLNETTAANNVDGEFVTFPGYEWSANSGLGGDHNVYFLREDETLHRSSHALVDDHSDLDSDCRTIGDLFKALDPRTSLVSAHVGGRYAVLEVHDPCIQRSVEVHSAWGTFEWLLEDAFAYGYRVGVVCNSDGHKGRPGASYPGASQFGSYGGLTCVLADALTRTAVWDAYRRRHHYGTTGARICMDVLGTLDSAARLFEPDGSPRDESSAILRMGDIARVSDRTMRLDLMIHGTAPVDRVDVLRGTELVLSHQPGPERRGNRVSVLWSGAAFRGRGRQVGWNGTVEFVGTKLLSAVPVNFWNPERPLERKGNGLSWASYTTGGVAGVICTLDDARSGRARFQSEQLSFDIVLGELGNDGRVFDAGGLKKTLRVQRLADENDAFDVGLTVDVPLAEDDDNPVFVRVVQEDGHMAWSSPMYAVRS